MSLVKSRRRVSSTRMGRDDLICVPGMMGADGLVIHLPVDYFAGIARWSAGMIVEAHKASMMNAPLPANEPEAHEPVDVSQPTTPIRPDTCVVQATPDAPAVGHGGEPREAEARSRAVEGEDLGGQSPQDIVMADPVASGPASGSSADGGDDNAWRHLHVNFPEDASEQSSDLPNQGSPPDTFAPTGTTGIYDPGTPENDPVAEYIQALSVEGTEEVIEPGADLHQPTGGSRTSGTVDVIDLTAEGDAPRHGTGSSRALQLLYRVNTLPLRDLDSACSFFCASREDIHEGLAVPGTAEALNTAQLAFIFQVISRSLDAEADLDGQILADDTGMGKSHCAMGLVAVMRLLVLTEAHVKKYPDQHNARGVDSPCPAENPYGIQCVCVAGSLGSRYVHRLTKGPALVLSPSHIVEQWVARAADYFLPRITAKGSNSPQEFVQLLSWSEGHLVRHPLGDPERDVVNDHDTVNADIITVGITTSSNPISRNDHAELKRQDAYQGLRWLRDKKGLRLKADFGKAVKDDQSMLVAFVSTTAISQSKFTDKVRAYVSIRVSARSTPIQLPFSLPILPTLVIFDECHSIKDDSTKFWKQLFDLQQVARSGALRTQWCFLSATPASTSPMDIWPICRVLFGPKSRGRAVERLSELNSQFRGMRACAEAGLEGAQRRADFADGLAHFLKAFTIARDRASPILSQATGTPGPQYSKVVRTVSIPAGLIQDVESLGAICRSELRKGNGPTRVLRTTITTQPVFTQYYCAAMMPGIAAAQIKQRQENDTYPSAAQGITRDMAKGDGGTIARFRSLHEGHDWLRIMIETLLRAHNDREHDPDGNPKHVLVLAATPSLTGHLAIILSRHERLRRVISVKRLSGDGVTARKRHQMLERARAEAYGAQKTVVVISTADLVGTGTDALTFCNYLVLFGELFKAYHEKQAIGRLCRRGQTLPVYIHYIRSEHITHEIIRKRNMGRQLMLSDLGLDETVDGMEDGSLDKVNEGSNLELD